MKKTGIKKVLSIVLLASTLLLASCNSVESVELPKNETDAVTDEMEAVAEKTDETTDETEAVKSDDASEEEFEAFIESTPPGTQAVACKYTVNSDKKSCTVTNLNMSAATVIEVPEKIEKYTVTTIGKRAFSGCSSLVIAEIPDTVTKIDDYAFENCMNLQEIHIGTNKSALKDLGHDIVYGDAMLSSIIYRGSMEDWKKVKTYYGDWFEGTAAGLTVSCTDGKFVYDWYGTPGPNRYPDEYPNIDISENLRFGNFYTDGLHEWTKSGWYVCWDSDRYNRYTVKEIILPSEYQGKPITAIGEAGFAGLEFLERIILPDSITYISDCAFVDCSSLKSIVVPDYVVLHGGPFQGCPALETVTLSEHVAFTFGYRAFADCPNLQYITYKGTSAQWYALEGVNDVVLNCPVHCTDIIIYP